jgi:hypothetical protein
MNVTLLPREERRDGEHARLRRIVMAPFTVRRMETMRPAVQKIVDDRIDALLAGPTPVDLVSAFALPVLGWADLPRSRWRGPGPGHS